MAEEETTCANYVEVEKSIDTVSTWRCNVYKTKDGPSKLENNGNSTTYYDYIYDAEKSEDKEAIDVVIKFIPSDELPDIYSYSASLADWPTAYAKAACAKHAKFDDCVDNKEIVPANLLPAAITDSSCNSIHRGDICKTNWNSSIKYPKSKKDLIKASHNSVYSFLYDEINRELEQRRQHPLYKDIEPLTDLDPYKIARNSTYNPNAGKVEVQNPGNPVEIEDFDTINKTLENMCRETVDPDVVQQLNLETETLIKPQDSINIVIDNAKKVLKDCICYTDCEGYSVCFCYSNCNHY